MAIHIQMAIIPLLVDQINILVSLATNTKLRNVWPMATGLPTRLIDVSESILIRSRLLQLQLEIKQCNLDIYFHSSSTHP